MGKEKCPVCGSLMSLIDEEDGIYPPYWYCDSRTGCKLTWDFDDPESSQLVM